MAGQVDDTNNVLQQCPNVRGDVVADYNEGWHWIVGNSVLQWGSDKVWHVGSDNYVQCFCPKDKEGFTPSYSTGIQTRWLKVSNIREVKKEKLLSHGWLLWQNGGDFGLASEAYLAQNEPYHCKERVPKKYSFNR